MVVNIKTSPSLSSCSAVSTLAYLQTRLWWFQKCCWSLSRRDVSENKLQNVGSLKPFSKMWFIECCGFETVQCCIVLHFNLHRFYFYLLISRKSNLFLGRVNTFGQLTGLFVYQLIGLEELIHFLALVTFLLLWRHNIVIWVHVPWHVHHTSHTYRCNTDRGGCVSQLFLQLLVALSPLKEKKTSFFF